MEHRREAVLAVAPKDAACRRVDLTPESLDVHNSANIMDSGPVLGKMSDFEELIVDIKAAKTSPGSSPDGACLHYNLHSEDSFSSSASEHDEEDKGGIAGCEPSANKTDSGAVPVLSTLLSDFEELIVDLKGAATAPCSKPTGACLHYNLHSEDSYSSVGSELDTEDKCRQEEAAGCEPLANMMDGPVLGKMTSDSEELVVDIEAASSSSTGSELDVEDKKCRQGEVAGCKSFLGDVVECGDLSLPTRQHTLPEMVTPLMDRCGASCEHFAINSEPGSEPGDVAEWLNTPRAAA